MPETLVMGDDGIQVLFDIKSNNDTAEVNWVTLLLLLFVLFFHSPRLRPIHLCCCAFLIIVVNIFFLLTKIRPSTRIGPTREDVAKALCKNKNIEKKTNKTTIAAATATTTTTTTRITRKGGRKVSLLKYF